ncbi:MAG: hypothetical protein Q7T03_08950 [Deltaproteobacteria bacterium]|nr:hypothetical protein [Deltaproteobacteria bacterium]
MSNRCDPAVRFDATGKFNVNSLPEEQRAYAQKIIDLVISPDAHWNTSVINPAEEVAAARKLEDQLAGYTCDAIRKDLDQQKYRNIGFKCPRIFAGVQSQVVADLEETLEGNFVKKDSELFAILHHAGPNRFFERENGYGLLYVQQLTVLIDEVEAILRDLKTCDSDFAKAAESVFQDQKFNIISQLQNFSGPDTVMFVHKIQPGDDIGYAPKQPKVGSFTARLGSSFDKPFWPNRDLQKIERRNGEAWSDAILPLKNLADKLGVPVRCIWVID